ncbi:MAG: serine protease [Chitinophagales bacterium]
MLLWTQVDALQNHLSPILLNNQVEQPSTYTFPNHVVTDTNKDSIIHLLSGIKYVIIDLTTQEQQKADMDEYPIIDQLAAYFQEMGFKEIAYKTNDKTRLLLSVPTFCDLIRVRFNMTPKEDYYENIQLRLQTCRNDYVTFTYKEKFYQNENFLQNLYAIFLLFYNKQIPYNPQNRLKLSSNPIVTTKEAALTYLKENALSIDNVEGIFEKIPYYDFYKKKHTVAIIKNTKGNYDIIYLQGASNYLDWQEGEWMGEITPTSKEGKFEEVKWTTPDKILQINSFISLQDKNTFSLQFKNHYDTYTYQRLGNTTSITNTVTLEGKGVSGSGILVDKEGYIITSYNVVENAKTINVVLPKTDEETQDIWSAKLIASNPYLDLALLKISDENIPFCPPIPYSLHHQECDIGEKVFALGYPLVASMGMHPKLATGSISSVNSSQNTISTYQTTVQVYAGNSGSPLFDYHGRLIGIIKTKHVDAVKVSYSLKSSSILQFLKETNLFDITNLTNTSNIIENQPLTEQIKRLQPFVYYIYSY